MFALDEFKKDTRSFPLVTPDGTVHKEVTITVRGVDHDAVKQINRDLSLEVGQYVATKKKRGWKEGDPMDDDDFDFYQNIGLKRATAYVEEIKGMSWGGKEIGSDTKLIAEALSKNSFLVDLVTEEAVDTAGFCSK